MGGLVADSRRKGNEERETACPNYLTSVYFPSPLIGYAVGANGTIIKTIDGGNNWIIQNSGINFHLYSVHFINNDTGYATGTSNQILKTIDGGNNWDLQTDWITTNLLYSVFFSDANVGFAVGVNGSIYKTTNGGGLGIDEKNYLNGIIIYPNPASSIFTVSTEVEKIKELSVINVLGEEVLKETLAENTARIDVSSLAKGMYFIQVQTEKGVSIKKLIKE